MHNEMKAYTKSGWIPYEDLRGGDEILTMNTDREISFSKIRSIKHVLKENLTNIYNGNNSFKTCLAQDYKCLVYQNKQPTYRTIPELNSNSSFIRTCQNKQVSPETVDINGLCLDIEDFIFLASWYLSEGSVLHNTDTAVKKHYPIKITQEIHHDYVASNIDRICNKYGLHYIVARDYVEFYSEELYYYFLDFGYSEEKYIPDIIFECSREHIQLFLDYYIMGDGHETKPNNYNSIARSIFTSSPRMANDISFLVLLAGYYPCIYIHTKAGTETKHHNGIYKSNHDVYGVRLNKTDFSQYKSCTCDTLAFNGYACEIDVQDDAIWTMYQGKTCFI